MRSVCLSPLCNAFRAVRLNACVNFTSQHYGKSVHAPKTGNIDIKRKDDMTFELPTWAKRIAVFDTETTGISMKESRIVSACVAVLDENGETVIRHDWIIDPGVEIPEMAFRVHGISTERAKAEGIEASVGVQQIVDTIHTYFEEGLPLVAYNAPFDLTLLKYEAARYGIDFPEANVKPVFDPLVIDKELDKYRRGKRRLETVSEHYGVKLDNAHDAGADAIAAGQVLLKIIQKYPGSFALSPAEFHDLQVQWAKNQAASFQEFMRKSKDPSFTTNGSWPIK